MECEIIVVNEPLVVETMRMAAMVDTLHRNLLLDFSRFVKSNYLIPLLGCHGPFTKL
jgi:hypothetical protein